MIKFLTTQGINYHLEELLKNAQKEIILISPYLQLQSTIKEILSQKKDNGLDIIFVCRVNDLKEDLSRVSTKIFDCPKLHAKCYMNENEAIVTSLNLYEFSQKNNRLVAPE
jgi:phosphatidylserine/phosphatidylglycerophosphate/cardiolipin synthase-like enzyme